MPPAHQGFEFGCLIRSQTDQRLIVDLEALSFYRVAQVHFQSVAGFCSRIHLRLEKLISSTTGSFCGIQCQISILYQLINLTTIRRRNGDPDAGVSHNLMAKALVRLSDCFVKPND